MELDEFINLPSVHSEKDVAYLPRPNTVDIVLTSTLAPDEYTRTVFVVPFYKGNIVLAHNRRRGFEIPGGHIEEFEDYAHAAYREVIEETGCVINDLYPIGFQRMISYGEAPSNWKYPHPVGFQQYFAANVSLMMPYKANDECFEPKIFTKEDAAKILRHRAAFIIN